MKKKHETGSTLDFALLGCVLAGSWSREPFSPAGPAAEPGSSLRRTWTADVTTGSVPLTVNFTGKLTGPLETLSTLVPEASLLGGDNPEEVLYTPDPGTTTRARASYAAREHYFRQGVFPAVMIVHGIHGDICSDTLLITVH